MEHTEKKCVIISGGQYSPINIKKDTNELNVIVDYIIADYVIVCDKGYEYALCESIEPDYIIGDFDSCSDEIRAQVEHMEENVERYPSEKDDTDTMLAIKHALKLGYQRIDIRCGLGGRLDHLYANIQSLVYAARHGALCSMEDEENCIYAMGPGRIELPRRAGWSISLFAASDSCKGITTSGLKYSLNKGVLVNDFPLGMSNEWESEKAVIELEEGILLIILSKK